MRWTEDELKFRADDRLLTPREAAAVERCTENHLAKRRSSGADNLDVDGLPYIRKKGRVFYIERLLLEWISRQICFSSAELTDAQRAGRNNLAKTRKHQAASKLNDDTKN